jgi:pseudaminic acid synthase
MTNSFRISGRPVGPGNPVFIIAEMSANHNKDFDEAVRIIRAAKECGADAVKLQTYTPDTLTIDSDSDYFRIKEAPWKGETLYSLYKKAFMPWEWQPRLKEVAEENGIILFSTPFDKSSTDFLERMGVSVYKIASFELVDIPLIEYVASKGKPVIMSTGMATVDEMREAVDSARGAGTREIALLKCTSAYPAPPEEMNLKTISDLAVRFRVVSGLSDHTMGIAVSVASVALGACIIERHFTLSRARGGPDASFSIEPHEFKAMVDGVRTAEKALGTVDYELTEKEKASRVFRRSLFVVKDVRADELFTEDNVRSIRPGHGLPPKYLKEVVGKKAAMDIRGGTPLGWELIA